MEGKLVCFLHETPNKNEAELIKKKFLWMKTYKKTWRIFAWNLSAETLKFCENYVGAKFW